MSFLSYFDEILVYPVASTQIDAKTCGGYLGDFCLELPGGNDLSDTQRLIEIAGRHCYMSFGKKAGKKTTEQYIKNILQHKHYSVLEHISITFIIRGMSRYCSHELVRHRHLSFSQFSTRYCDDISFVIPPLFRDDDFLKLEFLKFCSMSFEKYEHFFRRASEVIDIVDDERFVATEELLSDYDLSSNLMKKKLARGAARFALVGCIEAPMVVSGNLRSWLEFLDKRDSKFADLEIRDLAKKISKILSNKYPFVFG